VKTKTKSKSTPRPATPVCVPVAPRVFTRVASLFVLLALISPLRAITTYHTVNATSLTNKTIAPGDAIVINATLNPVVLIDFGSYTILNQGTLSVTATSNHAELRFNGDSVVALDNGATANLTGASAHTFFNDWSSNTLITDPGTLLNLTSNTASQTALAITYGNVTLANGAELRLNTSSYIAAIYLDANETRTASLTLVGNASNRPFLNLTHTGSGDAISIHSEGASASFTATNATINITQTAGRHAVYLNSPNALFTLNGSTAATINTTGTINGIYNNGTLSLLDSATLNLNGTTSGNALQNSAFLEIASSASLNLYSDGNFHNTGTFLLDGLVNNLSLKTNLSLNIASDAASFLLLTGNLTASSLANLTKSGSGDIRLTAPNNTLSGGNLSASNGFTLNLIADFSNVNISKGATTGGVIGANATATNPTGNPDGYQLFNMSYASNLFLDGSLFSDQTVQYTLNINNIGGSISITDWTLHRPLGNQEAAAFLLLTVTGSGTFDADQWTLLGLNVSDGWSLQWMENAEGHHQLWLFYANPVRIPEPATTTLLLGLGLAVFLFHHKGHKGFPKGHKSPIPKIP
jgi:hypothetical protein